MYMYGLKSTRNVLEFQTILFIPSEIYLLMNSCLEKKKGKKERSQLGT
jgi:hypothetical protein